MALRWPPTDLADVHHETQFNKSNRQERESSGATNMNIRHFGRDSHRDRMLRLRERIKSIKPEDQDMIALLGVLKGLMDIVDDAAEGRK